jgi:hypothetical protein
MLFYPDEREQMQSKQVDKTYFIFLEKDEPVMKTLTEFCSKNSIQNGEISGIGAVKNIEIGAFDPDSKSYIHKKFDKTHELISCMGNITLKDGEPFIHAHITIGDHDMNVKGGHVFEMTVAVVGEFYIRKIDGSIHRELNGDVGLAVCRIRE